MKKIILFSIALFSIKTSIGATINLTTSLASPTYNRPDIGTPPSALNTNVGTAVHYTYVPITATSTTLTISSSSTFDNFGVLYTSPGLNVSNPLSNSIRANDDKPGAGTNFGFTRTVTIGTVYYLVVSGRANGDVGAISITITGGTFGIPLPVNYAALNAKAMGESNLISWTTAEEKNNAYFDVQKSVDGINFASMGTVNAKYTGSTNTGYDYEFIDTKPSITNYYRLKQVDIDGHFEYSGILKVVSEVSTQIEISPNPAKDVLTINTNFATQTKYQIVDMGGKIMMNNTINFSNTKNSESISISKLPIGNYIFVLENAKTNYSFSQKFTKQ